MQRDDVALMDIMDALRKTLRFTEGMSEEAFLDDDKTQSAVIRQLEIAGEATKRLSGALREKYPAVRWRECGTS